MLIGSQRRRWKIVKPRVKSGALYAQLPEQLPLAATEANGSNPAIKYLYIKYIWRLNCKFECRKDIHFENLYGRH